jgi:hypothetical protein
MSIRRQAIEQLDEGNYDTPHFQTEAAEGRPNRRFVESKLSD